MRIRRTGLFAMTILVGATEIVVARSGQPLIDVAPNIDVAPEFRPFVERMVASSPTFRRQCARLGAAPRLRVRLTAETLPRPPLARARSQLSFDANILVLAEIYLRHSTDLFELIGHEVEHIIEQLDGVQLDAHAGKGSFWRTIGDSFETRRAIDVGKRVAREMQGSSTTVPPLRWTAPLADTRNVRLRDRDSTPLSFDGASVSATGRHVALVSWARLGPEDVNDLPDLYVVDLESGATSLETAGANGSTRSASISADGRFVVFASEAGNLTAPSFPAGTSQIFLRDRQTAATTLLTDTADGRPANGPSWNPVISADGTMIAFESGAPDLLSQPGGGSVGVYVFDRTRPRRQRVDVSDAVTMTPSINADGSLVVVTARRKLAGRLLSQVYVFDSRTARATLVSRAYNLGEADGNSYHPAVSGDGRYVAFVSEATNLTRQRVPESAQIYRHDLSRGSTELISRSPHGLAGNAASLRPALSSNGQRVAFQSLASNLQCDRRCRADQRDVNLLWDVFVYDVRTRWMTRVSSGGAGEWMDNSRAPSIDGAGQIIAFSTRHPLAADDVAADDDLLVGSLKTSGVAARR